MKFKRFAKPKFLEQIGRGQLNRLLEKFEPEFIAHQVTLPPTTLEDKEYYAALARLAVTGQGFPENFSEALYSIEVLANPTGRARLLAAVEQHGVNIERIQTATDADIAVQVLLADPELFAQKHDETRIASLSSFDYFNPPQPVDRRTTFAAPTPDDIRRIKADIDLWLETQHDGAEHVTEVEPHELDGEHWFLIRRGDSSMRVPTVEGNSITVRHLRPARDVVVVYNPERDDLRLHGKSLREKRMLKTVLGQRLFGDPDYFALPTRFTLAPLRRGRSSLQVAPGGRIERIVLTKVVVKLDDEHQVELCWSAREGNDLFAFAEATGAVLFPPGCHVLVAGLDVYFAGQAKPRSVTVRDGNKLGLTRNCDAAAVHQWLAANEFRQTSGGDAAARMAA